MIRSIRPAPIPLLIAAALCLAVALATFPTAPAHAQSGTPAVSIRTDLTEVSEGRPVVFTLTRTGGDVSSPLTVRVGTREPNHPGATFGSNPSQAYHLVNFEAGAATATLSVPTSLDQVDDADNDWLEASIRLSDNYRLGFPDTVTVAITAPNKDDVLVIIAAAQRSVTEGAAAIYTLTRTGDITSARTVNVAVDDPGDVMRGDPWEGDPTLPTQAVFEANQSSATLTLATRQNLRDTPDQTLAVSLEEGSGYYVSLPLRASVTVADDDTAPEVSLSVDKTGAVEGDFLTFTLTRHGDISQAMDSIVLTIGPNRARHNAARYRVDRPQDYGATMAPGVATAQVTVQVMEVVTRSPESDFRYQARIKASRPVPGEHESQYFTVRGPRTVGALVTDSTRYPLISITDESDGERWHEGQEVSLSLTRQFADVSEELEVRLLYVEVNHPHRVLRTFTLFNLAGNPSVRFLYHTFPAGSDRVDITLTIGTDDVDEWWEEDYIALLVRPVWDVDPYLPAIHSIESSGSSDYSDGIFHQIFDNPRTVSIAADSTSVDEGEAADFTLTRDGPTAGPLAVNISIEDPGGFLRGNHGQSAPTLVREVIFEAGSAAASLSLPTRDDRRDIADDDVTVTVRPTQDGSYEGSYRVVEGSGSASVTVADNDAAPQIELSVDRTEAVEGETVTFRLTRIGDARNSVELPVLFGIDGEQTPTVYGLGPGETTLTRVIQTVDDDFDGPNVVYEATLLPLDGVPEEDLAQYWTVKGPRSVTVTISDNDLPVVGLEAVSESYIENQYGQIRLVRVGQTDRELAVNARVSQSGHDIDQIYAHLIGDRSITIRRSRDARDNLFLLAGDDGDEDDGAITMQLLEGAGYRIDPERSVASFTVIDTDPTPTLSVADATASEGGGTIDFEVSLSSTTNPPSRRTVTVDYATRDGTALAGEDYTTTRGTLTFRPKARSATISVPVLDDRLAERDQTFTLTLSNPRFGEFEDGESSVSAIGAIEDDEPIVSIAAADDEVTEGVDVVFTVTRTGATTETLPVKLYIYQTGSPNPVPVIEPLVVFPAGSATVDYAVETEDDDLDHGTIVVTASVIDPADRGLTPTYQSAGEFAVVEVRDNDLPIVSIEAVKEGAREGEDAQFVLTREGDLRASLTVYVNVTPEDISLSGAPPATATFGPSASQVNLSAPTVAGSLNQDGAYGRVNMAISSNASYRIGESGSARVVFFDSSYTGPTVSISSNSPVVDEGDDVVFTLTRTGPALLELTARVRVTEVGHNVLRLTDGDLTDESHKIDGHEIVKVEVVDVVFEPGARTATLTRTTEDEALNDGNSTIRAAILLSSDHGILPFPGFKVVWVRDDDIPTVTVTPGSDERPVEECEREGVEGTVPCMVEFRGDKPFTFHRTGDASTLLHVNTDAMSISYFEPPFEDRVVPRRDVDWTAFLPGESSHVRTFTPQLVRPLGAEASVWLVPHYCAEAPGDCGRRPQYHVGTPSSGVLYVYNNELVVRVEADQSSVTEGETATFTLSRFGGTRTGRVDTKHVRVEVTQNGEFIEGVPPQIVTFWGIPHRSADDAEETKALRIPTTSDLVDEENGAITVRVLPWGDAAPDHDPEDNYQYFYDTLRTPATVTVIDDDLPGISISDATAAEGDGSLEFTVTASGIGQQVTVDWATADGAGANAATAGEDYTAASGALTFAVGETSKTITVTALDDGLDEDNETFTVNLSNPSGAMVTTATGTGTIEDDDDGRVVVTIWTPDDNVMEGQNAVFSLKRWADSSSLPEGFGDFPLTVNLWITQDGDFIADSAPGTVTFPVTATFPAQHMRILLNVPTDDDDKQEDNGSVTVAVADGSGYSAIIGREATVNVTDNDLGIWIADAEPGVEGAGPHIFTVSLSGAYAGTVTVDVSTVDGEATSDDAPTETSLGKDFEAKSETLTFAPGETEKQFAVTSVDDLLDEARESFTVELSNPSANVQLVDAVAAGEIRDNDGKMIVGLHRDTLRVSENQDGPVNFYFELSPAVGSDTSAVEKQTVVRWKVTAGSATPGEDYVEAQGRTVIPLGGLTGVAEVSLLDDDLFEETFETFTFEITSALNLDLDEGKQSIEIRIRDNENMWAEVTAASDSVVEGGDAAFTVSLSRSMNTAPVEVTYTVRGTAGSADYTAPSGTLTIPAGEPSASFRIPTLMDNVLDPDETLEVVLVRAASSGREVPTSGELALTTILDEGTMAASIAQAKATEGEPMEFTISLSVATDVPVKVKWETEDAEGPQGRALENVDYATSEGTVTIPAGQTSGTFTVTTHEDNLAEGNETFRVSLTVAMRGDDPDTATPVALGVVTAEALILDDDDPPTGVTLTVTPGEVAEGAGETMLTVTATLVGGSVLPGVTPVSLTVKDGAATAGDDYTATTATLTIPAGELSNTATLTLTPVDDNLAEGAETVRVTGRVSGLTVTGAELTITDNDAQPTGVTLTVTPDSVGEGAGETALAVSATLTGGSPRLVDTPVTLSVEGVSLPSEEDGGDPTIAATNADFTANGVTLTIRAGRLTGTGTLTLTPEDDLIAEGDETVQVSGAAEGLDVTPAPLTIEDDDEAPDRIELSVTPETVGEDAGAGEIQVTALFQGGGSRTVDTTVSLQVHGVTATAGEDYAAQPDVTLIIRAGHLSGTASLTLTPVNDTIYEGEEQVAIRGTNTDPGLPVSGVRLPITDDDEEPTTIDLSVDKDTVSEDGGSQQLRVTARLQGSSQRSVDTPVRLTLVNGTATNSDYTALPRTVTIRKGKPEGTVTVVLSPTDDSIDEPDETLELRGTTSQSELTASPRQITIIDDDTAGVTVSESALTIEEGGDATYTVRLDTQPTDSVTVTVNDPADTDVTAEPASLTFSASTWSTAQTVTVSAKQDDDAIDEEQVTITHTVSGADYGSVSASDVAVTVTDDDDPAVRVSFGASAYSVDEGSGVTVKVQLSADPERTVTIPLSAADRGGASNDDYSGVPDSVVFGSGETEKSFTFTAAADEVDDDGESVELSFGTLPDRVTVGSTAASAITITDDDTAGVTVSESALTIEEGGDATYTVRLDTQPTDSVTVTVNDPADTDVTAEPASLTFSASTWSTAQTVTVSAKQDDDAIDEEQVTITHTVSGADYGSVSASDVAVTVTDDDDPAVRVSFGASAYSVDEGSGVTVKVQLSADPERTVTIPLSATDRGGASNDDYSGVPDSVVFGSGETEKSFTFTAATDEVDDDGESVELSFGTLPDRVTVGSTATSAVSITDDDTAGVTVSESALTIEEGGDATYTVRLDTQPTDSVTVTVNDPANTDVTAEPASLTFSASTWSTAQTVTVSAKQDDDAIDEEQVTITHTVSGADYGSVSASDVAVTVTDDDDPAVRVSFEQGAYSVAEGSGVTVKVQLSADPERTVTIPLSATDRGGASNDDYCPGCPIAWCSGAGRRRRASPSRPPQTRWTTTGRASSCPSGPCRTG